MNKRDRIVALLLAFVLIMVTISVWVMPRKAYAFDGTGEVYTSDGDKDEKEEKETGSGSSSEVGNAASGLVSSVDEALGKMNESANEIFDTSGYDEIRKDYKTPEIVHSVNDWGHKITVASSDTLAQVFMAFSGAIIIHGALAVLFTGYYDFFKDKKYNMLIGSVETARSKNGGDGSTATTTTTGTNGTVTSNVVNTAKKITGPASVLIGYLFDSVIYLAIIIAMFLLIKNGFVQILLKGVISLFTAGAQWLSNIVQGSLK